MLRGGAADTTEHRWCFSGMLARSTLEARTSMSVDSSFVDAGEITMHCLRWGDAKPSVVLIHGSSQCGGVWQPLAERLAAGGLTVVAPDLRGHGLSDKPDAGYGWSSLRDDLVGFFNALDLQDVLLAGHSRGGGVALLTAAALPHRVRSVLVYEPTMPDRTTASDSVSPNAERVVRHAERARERRVLFPNEASLIAHWRDRPAFSRWDGEYLRAYVEHGAATRDDGSVELRCPPWVEALLYEALLDSGAWDSLGTSALPMLAVYGDRGGRIGTGKYPLAGLRGMFPRSELQIMPDATHFGPMEQPAVFEQILREFAAQTRVGDRDRGAGEDGSRSGVGDLD